MLEPNIYFEKITKNYKKGFEFGISYYSAENPISIAASSFGNGATKTYGDPYGLGSVFSPIHFAGHKGYSSTLNLKFYNSEFKNFIGAQIVLGYKELLNGYYTNHDLVGPGYSKGYYWFRANHYSKRIGILGNFGISRGIGKNLAQIEFGGAVGANLNFDNLKLIAWGSQIQNSDPNFINYDKMKKPKYTDGFYIRPSIRIYFNLGLDFLKKGKENKSKG